MGIDAALGDQKAEDGEGHPSDAPQPHDAGEQRIAHVVDEHGADGDELQVEAVEELDSLHVSSPFASRITPPSTQQTPSSVQMLRASWKNTTPVSAATTGSTLAMMEALPLSTPSRPLV